MKRLTQWIGIIYSLPEWMARIDEKLETIMAGLDDLNAALDSISTDVEATLAHVTELETEVTALKNTAPPSVDLSGVMSKVTAIRNKLEGISTTVAAVPASTDTPTTPAPTPPA